jgi:hypothetical protein
MVIIHARVGMHCDLYHKVPELRMKLKGNLCDLLCQITDPIIIEESHFECVRLRRTHSKCELHLNFRIATPRPRG